MVVFIVFLSCLFTTKLRCLQKNNIGHTKAYGRHKIIKNDTFENLVLEQKYFWPEVVIGPKCALSQSMLGAKVSVGAKWSWGQTGCEPIYRLLFINWLPISALRRTTWLPIEVFEKKYVTPFVNAKRWLGKIHSKFCS